MRTRAGAAQAGPFPAARSLAPACRRNTEAVRPARSFRCRLAALVAVIAVFLAALPGLLPAAHAQEKETEKDWRAVLAVSQAAMGREIGDFRFTDSKGREVAFSEFRGRPLLVSFVYTGCFQACPVATKFLMEAVETARKALGDDRFSVVSIGFNQPFDNPVAMASFARQNGIDDPRWFFLTPRAGEVEALAARFGFVYEATPKGFDHVTQVSVVDPKGVIYRQVYGENFDLPMLVQPLRNSSPARPPSRSPWRTSGRR
jgi:protein SCO1/2